MDKKFILAWLKHNLDPESNERPEIPEGRSVADVRVKCIDLLCKEAKIDINKDDPLASLQTVAEEMRAFLPDGNVDQQTAKLFQLATGELSDHGGSSPG